MGDNLENFVITALHDISVSARSSRDSRSIEVKYCDIVDDKKKDANKDLIRIGDSLLVSFMSGGFIEYEYAIHKIKVDDAPKATEPVSPQIQKSKSNLELSQSVFCSIHPQRQEISKLEIPDNLKMILN